MFSEEHKKEWRKAELGRMALALYTIQGFAYLLHVSWPVAFQVLFEKKCYHGNDNGIFFLEEGKFEGENWLEFVLRESQSEFLEKRGGIDKYTQGEEMRLYNDNWITYYLARNMDEFENVLAEKVPPRDTGLH
uniref:CdiI_4 domain-containing protein n=1 Tax=Meloidogyne hapla TaxID=6305 RepID=A0A1I8BNA5_MELHA